MLGRGVHFGGISPSQRLTVMHKRRAKKSCPHCEIPVNSIDNLSKLRHILARACH